MKLSLIENAKDSLSHAVEHLSNPDGIKPNDFKRVILDIGHTIELLIKEKIKRIHPAFIWDDIDKYPSCKNKTINTFKAMERLNNIANIKLDDKQRQTIIKCRELRNNIEHYEFDIEDKEAKGVIGRMLSLIFFFSKEYLEMDMEEEFRNNNRWSSLLEIYEFYEAHKVVVEEDLFKEQIPVLDCPSCGAATFIIDDSKCKLCEHEESITFCEMCSEESFETEMRTVSIDEYSNRKYICQYCFDKLEDSMNS